MLKLHNLKPAPGSKHRKKIVGRGPGSGHGMTSTRGMKGQSSRSGDGKMLFFEGGQTPLWRRIPKRGFTNAPFKKQYSYVNVKTLEKKFEDNQTITPQILSELKIVKKNLPLKILGDGEITKKLTVKAHKFSKAAAEKIIKAGGKIEIIKDKTTQAQRH